MKQYAKYAKQSILALAMTLSAASGFARGPEMNCGPLQIVDASGNGRLVLQISGRLAAEIQAQLEKTGPNNGISHLTQYGTNPYPLLQINSIQRVQGGGSSLQYSTGGPIGVSISGTTNSIEKLLTVQTGRMTSSRTVVLDEPIFTTINCLAPWN